MGLISILFGLNKTLESSEKEEKQKRLEKEMDYHNLDDDEKEEVRKGNYDIYNFEDTLDEDLDEDDYYFEDDK